jgi:hypothetical protein
MKFPTLLVAVLLTATPALAQLQGVIDVHAHVDPETIPRSIDAMDLARLARKEGMRGLVLKNHYVPTAPIAFLVAREVPGIEVFGAIVLNNHVGGINPAAVEQMARLRGNHGRIVWMPTMDAARGPGEPPRPRTASPGSGARSEYDRTILVESDGKLSPEVIEVFKIIAREKLALATGHATPETTLLLVREARRMGIERIIVTHPVNRLSLEQQKQAAAMGAFLEYCFVGTLEFAGARRKTFAEYAEIMKALGPEQVIMSSDLGNAANPIHTAGWKSYIAGLKEAGITEEEIDLMARRNPAKLLGVE